MTTKLSKKLWCPAFSVVLLWLTAACGVDRWEEYKPLVEGDTWIYDTMYAHYLWADEMPPYDAVNPFLPPEKFLASLINKADGFSKVDTDRVETALSQGITYEVVKRGATDSLCNLLLTNVVPHSPAAVAGLHRGDWVVQIDGADLTPARADSLMRAARPMKMRLGKGGVQEAVVDDKPVKNFVVTPTEKVVQLGAPAAFALPMVPVAQVLQLPQLGNVGYLFVQHLDPALLPGERDAAAELLQLSNSLAAASVRATIVDLRLCSRGSVEMARLLGTLLVPAERLGSVMLQTVHGERAKTEDRQLTFDPALLKGGTNLNQPLIIFLTGEKTAGAAEQLVAGLYSDKHLPATICIGSPTAGRNVLTQRFVHPQKGWTLNIVTALACNAQGEVFGKITPGKPFIVSEAALEGEVNYSRYLPFGNPNEALLHVALLTLAGDYPPRE